MTTFTGTEALVSFLGTFDEWLSEPVSVYLLGGSAMTVHGMADSTDDVDLAVGVTAEFEHVSRRLRDEGFVVEAEPTASFEDVGRTVEFAHAERGLRLDVFERQVVGKVRLSERMRDRADELWSGTQVDAAVLSDEDLFLLKAVSAGDLASGRRRDLEDMAAYAQRGLDYDTVIQEIEAQRPFNTGATEATQIRDRSHPLFAIDVAVSELSGLPSGFTSSVSSFGDEFEVEYFVLDAVEAGLTDVDRIRAQVTNRADALSAGDGDGVESAVERLVGKRVLTREDGVLRTAL